MATNPALKPLTTLSTSQETLKNAEAREWMQRYKTKSKDLGANAAASWWKTTINDIERKRGIPAADDLRRRMNNQK
jgi:hypothetical protein